MYSLTEHRSKTTSWLNDVVVCFIFMASIASFIYGWQGMHSVFNGRDLPVISWIIMFFLIIRCAPLCAWLSGFFTQCYFQLSSRFWQQNMHR